MAQPVHDVVVRNTFLEVQCLRRSSPERGRSHSEDTHDRSVRGEQAVTVDFVPSLLRGQNPHYEPSCDEFEASCDEFDAVTTETSDFEWSSRDSSEAELWQQPVAAGGGTASGWLAPPFHAAAPLQPHQMLFPMDPTTAAAAAAVHAGYMHWPAAYMPFVQPLLAPPASPAPVALAAASARPGSPVKKQPWNSTNRGGESGSRTGTGQKSAADAGGAKQKAAFARSPMEKETLPPTAATTLMIRNIPCTFSQSDFLKLLDDGGFECDYDFVYLPMDFRHKVSLSYAFVNFCEHTAAVRAMSVLSKWSSDDKVLEVSWSKPCQGRDNHIERYKNSPVMHESMPDSYKPALFEKGKRQPFPPPTRQLRAPKLRPLREKPDAA